MRRTWIEVKRIYFKIPHFELLAIFLLSHASVFVSPAGELRPSSGGRPPSTGSEEGQDTNIVEQLLGNIRSGFPDKLGDFSPTVTKVNKVHLDGDSLGANMTRSGDGASDESSEGELSRSGSLRGSKKGMVASRLRSIQEAADGNKDGEDRRSRRSGEGLQETDELIDFLMNAGDEDKAGIFERQGSQRRSRRRRGNLDAHVGERERAPSPSESPATNVTPQTAPKSTERRWRASIDRTEVDKPSTPASAEPPTRSRNCSVLSTDSEGHSERSRWSNSSTETPEPETEAVKERQRRREERKKRRQIDLSDVSSALRPETTPVTSRAESTYDNAIKPSEEDYDNLPPLRRESIEGSNNSAVPSRVRAASVEERGNTATPPLFRQRSGSMEETDSRSQMFAHVRNNLGAPELASALRTIEESNKKKEESKVTLKRTLSASDTPHSRNKSTITRRYQSNLEPDAVNEVIKHIESGQTSNLSTLAQAGSDSRPRGRRWRGNREHTDMDGGVDNSGLPASQTAINTVPSDINDNQSSWINRRWRSNVDKLDVNEAINNNNNTISLDTPGWKISPESEVTSPTMNNNTINFGDLAAIRNRVGKREGESLTERALLEHSSGRWKSNIDKTEVDEAFKNFVNSEEAQRRPVSTYDNLSEAAKLHSQLSASADVSRRTDSSSSVSQPVSSPSKRWARYYENINLEEQSKEDVEHISPYATLPRSLAKRWQSRSEKPRDYATPSDDIGIENSNVPVVSNTDDVGYYSLDRGSRLRRSLRLGSLRTVESQSDVPIPTSALRKSREAKELELNVHQFQTRQPDADKERRKKRLSALSNLYSNEVDNWTPTVRRDLTAPIEDPSLPAIQASAVIIDDNHRGGPLDQLSPKGLKLPDDSHLSKSDTDSTTSAKDEGFDSESMSDPSASQRTSMSSTLDSELTGTPTSTRKEYARKTEQPEEQDETKNYFARSIESIVNKPELAACTTDFNIDDGNESSTSYSDRTPTSENGRLDVWASRDKVSPATTDSECKTVTPEDENKNDQFFEEYTVERILSPDEQQKLLGSRPPTPPERTTSIATTSEKKPPPTSRFSSSNKSKPGVQKSGLSKPSRPSSNTAASRLSDHKSKAKVTPTKSKERVASPKVSPKPARSKVADITARLSRPKKPTGVTLTRHPSNSSVASESSSTGTPSRPSRQPARPQPRPKSSLATPSRPSTSSTSNRLSSPRNSTEPAAPPTNPFVRGAAGRATMPAAVLRSNKREAKERDQGKDAPVPPARSSSIRVSQRLQHLRGTNVDEPEQPKSSPSSSGATSGASRPRKGTPGASSSFTSRDISKPDSNVGKLMNRFSSGHHEEARPTKPGAASFSRSRPRDLPLKDKSSATSRDSLHSADSDSKKDKSPSFIKKMIDKSPYRKSNLNKGDTHPPSDRNKVTVIRGTSKISKC